MTQNDLLRDSRGTRLPSTVDQTGKVDPLTTVLSAAAVVALEKRIEITIEQKLSELLPRALEGIRLSPWLDTKNAAEYVGISENALRLRVREALVPAHRDGAGRLRFHRRELDQAMTPDEPGRGRR